MDDKIVVIYLKVMLALAVQQDCNEQHTCAYIRACIRACACVCLPGFPRLLGAVPVLDDCGGFPFRGCWEVAHAAPHLGFVPETNTETGFPGLRRNSAGQLSLSIIVMYPFFSSETRAFLCILVCL